VHGPQPEGGMVILKVVLLLSEEISSSPEGAITPPSATLNPTSLYMRSHVHGRR
jgi:hypothetical protein